MNSLKRIVKGGLKWSIVEQLIVQLAKLIRLFLLFELLVPSDFGVFALSLIILGIPSILTEANIETAIIQSDKLDNKDLSSIFWSVCIYSLLSYGLIFIFAESISLFLEIQEAKLMLQAAAIIYFFVNLALVSRALLWKSLRFKLLAKVEIFSSFIDTIITLLFAFWGYGWWSLFIGLLSRQIISFPIYIFYAGWKPSFILNSIGLKKIYSFSRDLTLYRFVNWLMRYFDDLLIGLLFGKNALGIYERSYQTVHLPMRLVSNRINAVLLPSYSKINTAKDELSKMHLEIIRSSAWIFLPILGFILMFSNVLILNFLDEEWQELAWFIPVLGIGGIIHAFFNFNHSIFLSLGKSKLRLSYGLVTRGIILLAYLIGAFFGVKGIALGYTIGSLIAFFPETHRALQEISLTLTDFWKVIQKPFILVSKFIIIGFLLEHLFSNNLMSIVIYGFIYIILIGYSIMTEFTLFKKK